MRNLFQVQAAVSALKYHRGLAKLPVDFPIPATRNSDMLDFLHYIFGFQVCTWLKCLYSNWCLCLMDQAFGLHYVGGAFLCDAYMD